MKAFTISSTDVTRCPRQSLAAGHYREDGSCWCFTVEGLRITSAVSRALRRWAYNEKKVRELDEARAGLTSAMDVLSDEEKRAYFQVVAEYRDGQ